MSKLKVLLAFIYNDGMTGTMEEIGISYIASVLRENDYDVMLLSENEKKLNYKSIIDYKPDVIGFTVYENSNESIQRVSEKINLILPDTIICIGGVYATYAGTEMLEECKAIDFSIKGEGEETFLELVEKIYSKGNYNNIKGIIYRENEEITENECRPLIEDLNTLPLAARDILAQKDMKIALISGSRGCCASCAYCATQLFWKKWRGRSVKSIVDEIELLVNKYQVRKFNFIDSSIEDPYTDLRRVTEIAHEIIKRNLQIAYYVDFRAEFSRKVDKHTMELLIQSGLYAACIGIESGNDEDLKLYNKIANVEDNYRIMDLFKEYGLRVSPGFINFNPYSTVDKLRQNLKFLSKYGFSIKFIKKLAIYKGTAIYNKVAADGLLDSGKIEYGYKYLDEDVAKLSNFIEEYCDILDTKYFKAAHFVDFYTDLYPIALYYYKRILKQVKADKALRALEEFMEDYRKEVYVFNTSFSCWINELLNITEMGWDYNKVKLCTTAMMSPDKFTDIVKRLDRLNYRICFMLVRAGYESLITTV